MTKCPLLKYPILVSSRLKKYSFYWKSKLFRTRYDLVGSSHGRRTRSLAEVSSGNRFLKPEPSSAKKISTNTWKVWRTLAVQFWNWNRYMQHYWNGRFAISGFWQMQALHGKLVFPIKWHHEGAQKWSSLVENFECPLDITWWEKPVFHGEPVFAQTRE